MKATIQLLEPGTSVRRETDAEPTIYPDTTAGLQRGDAWILRIGAVTITTGAVDLLGLARLIRSGILGEKP